MSNSSKFFIVFIVILILVLTGFVFYDPYFSKSWFYINLRTLLELLYFVASIFLSITILINLEQLKISKDESQLRFARETATLTIKICNEFSEKIPKESGNIEKLTQLHLSAYKGACELDFSITKDSRLWYKALSDTSKINTNVTLVNELLSNINTKLNYLNVFALYFTSKMCNQALAFQAHGSVYCDMIERYYPIIAVRRKKDPTYLQPLVDLYITWKDNLVILQTEKLVELNNNCSQATASTTNN